MSLDATAATKREISAQAAWRSEPGASSPNPNVRTLKTFSAASLAGLPVPDREWVVPGIIPNRTVALLSGDGGVGKSLLALQLGVAMPTGTDWIGMLPECGGVLYLSAEDEKDEIHRRLVDITTARGLDLADVKDLHIEPLAGEDAVLAAPDGRSGQMAATPLWRAVSARLKALRPRLLIVDNSADAFGGNEISRTEVRQFVGLLRSAAIEYDMGVLLLSHPSLAGLTSGSGISGSTAWHNSVRGRLYLDRPKGSDDIPVDPDVRVLRTKKTNYGAIGDETRLRWEKGAFRLEESGPTGLDRLSSDAEAERCFLDLLARLTAQGREVSHKPSPSYAPTIFAKEPENLGLQKKTFERAMATLFKSEKIRAVPFGPPSRRYSKIVASDVV